MISSITREVVIKALQQFEEERIRRLGSQMVDQLTSIEEWWEKDLLSIVIPIFGDADVLRAKACLASIISQCGVNFEIILVEQTFDAARFKSLADSVGVKHVIDYIREPFGVQRYNLGRCRNVGLAACRGEYVYFSDADILYTDAMYFAKLLDLMRLHPALVLAWPRMKRVVLEGQKEFCHRFVEEPNWATHSPHLQTISEWAWQFDSQSESTQIQPITFVEATYHGKRYILRTEDYERYLAQREVLSGWEPLFWLFTRHESATLARRRHIDSVGGYAECFYQWGSEDADFHWKLSEAFCLVGLETINELEVVHLDHPRGWFDKHLFERNQLIRTRRRERGVIGTILTDVLENNSAYGRELRQRWKIHIRAIAQSAN